MNELQGQLNMVYPPQICVDELEENRLGWSRHYLANPWWLKFDFSAPLTREIWPECVLNNRPTRKYCLEWSAPSAKETYRQLKLFWFSFHENKRQQREQKPCLKGHSLPDAGWSAAVTDVIGFTWAAGGTHFNQQAQQSRVWVSAHQIPPRPPPRSLPSLLPCSLPSHSYLSNFQVFFWPQKTTTWVDRP